MTAPLALLASLLSAPLSETMMSVVGADGMSGSATVINQLLPDGGKYVRLSLVMTYENGARADVVQESTYDPKGRPVRFLQTVTGLGKRNTMVTEFDEAGAHVTIDPAKPPANVKWPEGPLDDPSQFWFVKTRPKVGQTVKFLRFRPAKLDWVESAVTYIGTREAVILGKLVTGNVVRVDGADALLDDSGDPLRLEVSGVTFERSAGVDSDK
ncbi:MAG: hypothetical protein KIT11_05695 [Fimbriimonadaceae bacterium]|nr:hypothetical protein [Fimbriimonadaceae bacterium]QYK56614.1 MAG: hypothetical protein KF733_03820 [Fimbriimonadaceae bacterium]